MKRISIPLVLLLVSAFLLSGCTQGVKDSFNKGREDAKQQLEKKDEPTPTQSSYQVSKDITLLTSLKAGLDEQYNLAKTQKAATMDTGWLQDFNSTLTELGNRYKDINVEKDKAGFYVSVAIGDLRTLAQEYDNSLQGKNADINFFSNAFDENIGKAKENLPQ